MNSTKDPGCPDAENSEQAAEKKRSEFEEWFPLRVREARRAREMRDDIWPYVWMNCVSIILLFAAAVIMAYRVGATELPLRRYDRMARIQPQEIHVRVGTLICKSIAPPFITPAFYLFFSFL